MGRSIVDCDCSDTQTFVAALEDSKTNSGMILCIFGSRTFVPVSWMCKKQTSVSRSSTEPEVISLDAGLRMDGIPALDLWDMVIEISHSSNNVLARRNPLRDGEPKGNTPTPTPRRRNTVTEIMLSHPNRITLSQMQNLLTSKPCFTFLQTMKQ